MSDSLMISNIEIHMDENNRYCLNDLHRANGNQDKHRPRYFLLTNQAKAMISELAIDGIPSIASKTKLGTFAAKEIVYAYAMWMSPKFAIHVIQTFDAVVREKYRASVRQSNITAIDTNTLKYITNERNSLKVRESYQALINSGLIQEENLAVYKKRYIPTTKGIEYVKSFNRNGLKFKPEYHKFIVAIVEEYKRILSGDNLDMFDDLED